MLNRRLAIFTTGFALLLGAFKGSERYCYQLVLLSKQVFTVTQLMFYKFGKVNICFVLATV